MRVLTETGAQAVKVERCEGAGVDWTPKFVRRYADLRKTISEAAANYAADVRARTFPSTAETYTLSPRKKA